MSDARTLVAAFESGELVRPSADALNIVDLANCVAELAGVYGSSRSPNVAAIAKLIGPADHLVFVIVDGMGMNSIRSHGDGAFIAGHVVAELQTVFPTSTPVVLTSLATGVWPCAHGIPGWNVYLSEIDVVAEIIRYARRSDEKDLSELGMRVEDAFPVPSVVAEFDRDTVSYLPKSIAGTPFSNYTSGNTRLEAYEKLEDAVASIASRVSRSATRTMTQLYIPDLDSACHAFGTESPQVHDVLERVDRALAQLAAALPPGSRLVATADHGLLDFDAGQRFEIEPSDPLVAYLTCEPWGTARAGNFDVQVAKKREFEKAFQDRFGEFLYLLTAEEAVALELYGPGPLSPVMKRRIGTHLAVSKGPWLLEYHDPSTKEDLPKTKVSQHAGLTAEEMLVPLVVA